MLQPELIELLGSATPKIIPEKIPVIENRESEWHLQQIERGNENAVSPFGFRPQRLRFAVEDEYFEVSYVDCSLFLLHFRKVPSLC